MVFAVRWGQLFPARAADAALGGQKAIVPL